MSRDSSLVAHYGVLTKGITSLCFHPNGKHVLATSRSGGALLYNIEKQNRPFTFQARGFSPIRGVITPDGDSIYCSSIEGKLGLWHIHKPQPNLLKIAHPSRINDFDVWKQNGVIVTASNDKSMKLWTPNLEFITSFPDHNSQVNACACCPTADVVLSGDITGTLTLWDVRDKAKCPLWRKSVRVKGRNAVVSVDFDHTGVLFCTSTEDGKLAVWDRRAPEHTINTSGAEKQGPNVIQAHDVPGGRAVFHPRKPMILVAGTDNTPKIFDLEMSSLLYSFEGHDYPNCGCAWAQNGTLFATADTEGHILVWKMPRTRVVPTIIPRREEKPVERKKPAAQVTAEDLLNELDQMNMRARELNEHLVIQEKRLTTLAARYQC